MTTESQIAETLLADLSARGVVVTVAGDDIKLRGPATAITDYDVAVLRASKPVLIRLLRLEENLPIDDDAAQAFAMDEVNPADVPACATCGRLCDVQTLDDTWHCTPCDPLAEARRQRTERILRQVDAIRYTINRNG